jgi:hypothetical protein
MTLDRQDIEAVAVRVVELLERHEAPSSPRLVDAAELARRFGMERSWVYSHAAELGAVRLGTGPNARLRFDPSLAAKALRPLGKSAPKLSRKSSAASRGRSRNKIALLPIKGGQKPGVGGLVLDVNERQKRGSDAP